MKHSSYSSLSVSALLLGTLTLVGCGAALTSNVASVDATSSTPKAQVVTGVPIQGSVYGGHAPIQGSHVYLVQPGITGYGSAATSIISGGTANTNDPNVPAGAKYVLTDSTGSFNTGAFTCVVGQPAYIYAWGGNIGGGTADNNTNIVQLATLGNCPSSGNFYTAGNGALQYIYLNEVSTVAAAYTFQPFTLVTNNDAWHIGTSNTTQGLLGIANAANTAAQLYNIQGDAQISSSGDGEGHLANYQTQNNAGNGVVPQATIDSLANILAACVDSVPPHEAGSPCNLLFADARDDGTTNGTEPTDTATAALNIARFPAGNNSETNVDATYASDIYARQGSGTTPYVPQLTAAPHDWTIAIYYPVAAVTPSYGTATNSTLTSAESVAVDDLGQIWVTAQDDYIDRFTNLGALQVSDYRSNNGTGYIPGYVSVDGQDNAWTGSADELSPIFEAGANGAFNTTYGSNYQSAYTVVTNNAGDAFFFAQTTATSPNYGMFEYGPGGAAITGSPFNISGTTSTTTASGTGTLTITNATVATACNGVDLFGTCLGTTTYTYTFTATNPGTPTGAAALAAGQTVKLTLANKGGGGNRNWANLNGNQTVATANGTTFTVTSTTDEGVAGNATGTGTYTTTITTTTTTPGAVPPGVNVAHGAIDSDGDLWLTTENGGNTIARVSPTGATLFTPITTVEQPEFPAIDNSGNAWVAVQETASQIYIVSPTGGQTVLTSASTGAELTSTFGAAVDGNGNVWFANRNSNYGQAASGVAGTNSIVEINGGSSTPGTAQTAISPPTNYVPEAQYPAATGTEAAILNGPLNLAIDPSGNLWITNYTGGGIVELVGAAAPVVTPLSVAASSNKLGAKP